MSDLPKAKIDIGTRVELLSDRAGVYKRAVGGSIGVVRDKKIDEGFPMVYIEWDKEHWRYAGEPDGWTFESHFQPTEKTSIFHALDDPEAFAEQIARRIQDDIEDEDLIDNYIDKLNQVVSLLAESEGFIVIAARQEPHPKGEEKSIVVPYVFGGFMNEATMLLLEAQMVQMSAMAHTEMAQHILERLRRAEED